VDVRGCQTNCVDTLPSLPQSNAAAEIHAGRSGPTAPGAGTPQWLARRQSVAPRPWAPMGASPICVKPRPAGQVMAVMDAMASNNLCETPPRRAGHGGHGRDAQQQPAP